MAKRHKGGNAGNDDPVQLAQLCFERGDYRQAVKHARVAIRKSPGDVTKVLLEKVSLARADELLRDGHLDQSRDLLLPLVTSIKDPNLLGKLPDLLLRAGLVDQFPLFRSAVSDADRRAVEVNAFDRAVANLIHARTAEIREQAALVRSALEAVEAGKDEAAAESLRGIPRSSLAADWRYFVRGLSAWYANDAETVDANWNRLEPGRAPSRIVEQLTTGGARAAGVRVAADENPDRPSAATRRFGTRASAVLPASVMQAASGLRSSNGLQQVLLELANEDWEAVNEAFLQCRSALRQTAPMLLDRIAGKISSRIVHSGDETALTKFMQSAEAPPDDPHWNRARATLSEIRCADGDECLETAENRWLQCLRDIDSIDQFPAAEKQIARSLLNTRIGRMSVMEIHGLAGCSCGLSHKVEIADLRERAVEFLEHAIAAFPACIDPWRELIGLHEFVDDSAALIAARKRMLAQFPDDLELLVSAGKSELDGGDSLQARDYLLRARRLKPLDDALRVAVAEAHRSCARKFILATEFDAARAELDAALLLATRGSADHDSHADRVTHIVLLAVLELSAGNETAAGRRIDEALNMYTDPTAANLQLAIEAARVDLPQSVSERFERAWRQQAGGKCHTQTAGAVARLLSRLTRGACPERSAHGADALAYIKRANRVSFKSRDLRNVCVFLQIMEQGKLLEKHIAKGRKLFPDEPWFHLAAAQAEILKGEYDCRRKVAFDCFSRVLEICENSPDAGHQEMVEMARFGLSFLNEAGLRAPRRPLFTPSPISSDQPGFANTLVDAIGRMLGKAEANVGAIEDTDDDADEMQSAANSKGQRSLW